MSSHYKSLTRRTNPEVVPIFPLNGAVLLPACDLPLNIFEPRYLNMIDDALKNDRLIGMVQSQDKKLAKILYDSSQIRFNVREYKNIKLSLDEARLSTQTLMNLDIGKIAITF